MLLDDLGNEILPLVIWVEFFLFICFQTSFLPHFDELSWALVFTALDHFVEILLHLVHSLDEHLSRALVQEVKGVAIFILTDNDVLGHEQNSLQIHHNERLLNLAAVFKHTNLVQSRLIHVKEDFLLKRIRDQLEERRYILLSLWSLIDVSHVFDNIFLDLLRNFKRTHCRASHVNLLIEDFLFFIHCRQEWSHVAKNKSAEKWTKYNYEWGHKCLGIINRRYLVSNNQKNAVVDTFTVLLPGRLLKEIWGISFSGRNPKFFGVVHYDVPNAANPVCQQKQEEQKLEDAESNLEVRAELHERYDPSKAKKPDHLHEPKHLCVGWIIAFAAFRDHFIKRNGGKQVHYKSWPKDIMQRDATQIRD